MTNSSDRSGAAHPYARFIPREEVGGFAAWRPEALGDSATARAPATETGRSTAQQGAVPVSYTHLTLPTKRIV